MKKLEDSLMAAFVFFFLSCNTERNIADDDQSRKPQEVKSSKTAHQLYQSAKKWL